jgi:hypothetical protein
MDEDEVLDDGLMAKYEAVRFDALNSSRPSASFRLQASAGAHFSVLPMADADNSPTSVTSSHPDSDELLDDGSGPVVEIPAPHSHLHDEISHILNRHSEPHGHHVHSARKPDQAHRQPPSDPNPGSLASMREDFNRLIDDQAAQRKFEVETHRSICFELPCIAVGPNRSIPIDSRL